jgi:hypothetical protein
MWEFVGLGSPSRQKGCRRAEGHYTTITGPCGQALLRCSAMQSADSPITSAMARLRPQRGKRAAKLDASAATQSIGWPWLLNQSIRLTPALSVKNMTFSRTDPFPLIPANPT